MSKSIKSLELLSNSEKLTSWREKINAALEVLNKHLDQISGNKVNITGGRIDSTLIGALDPDRATFTHLEILEKPLDVTSGGTGANNSTEAARNILPSQKGNSEKFLKTNGTDIEWASFSFDIGADIKGVLPVENGGTGSNSLRDAVANVLAPPVFGDHFLFANATGMKWKPVSDYLPSHEAKVFLDSLLFDTQLHPDSSNWMQFVTLEHTNGKGSLLAVSPFVWQTLFSAADADEFKESLGINVGHKEDGIVTVEDGKEKVTHLTAFVKTIFEAKSVEDFLETIGLDIEKQDHSPNLDFLANRINCEPNSILGVDADGDFAYMPLSPIAESILQSSEAGEILDILAEDSEVLSALLDAEFEHYDGVLITSRTGKIITTSMEDFIDSVFDGANPTSLSVLKSNLELEKDFRGFTAQEIGKTIQKHSPVLDSLSGLPSIKEKLDIADDIKPPHYFGVLGVTKAEKYDILPLSLIAERLLRTEKWEDLPFLLRGDNPGFFPALKMHDEGTGALPILSFARKTIIDFASLRNVSLYGQRLRATRRMNLDLSKGANIDILFQDDENGCGGIELLEANDKTGQNDRFFITFSLAAKKDSAHNLGQYFVTWADNFVFPDNVAPRLMGDVVVLEFKAHGLNTYLCVNSNSYTLKE